MSHLTGLDESRTACQEHGECTAYDQYISDASARTQQSYQEQVVFTSLVGSVLLAISVSILLSWRHAGLRRFYGFVFSALFMIFPVVIGLIGGAIVGFMITFSACFKQECSTLESGAIWLIPLISLALTIPLAKLVSTHRRQLKEKMNAAPTFWLVVGSILSLLVMLVVLGGLLSTAESRDAQLEYYKSGQY